MLKKILSIALMVCASFTMSHAQNIEGVNARLDGWAGCGIPDDIGWICSTPRNFIKYPDYVQGNTIIKPYWGTKETFGSLILLKSLGPRVVAGITANNALIMSGGFYFRSFSFMNAGGDFGLTPEDMVNTSLPAYPQIGASFKITDHINIGVLGFGEGIKKKNEYKILNIETLITDSLDTAVVTIKDSVRNRSYKNFGFTIDANIGLGKIGFAPKISLSFPRIEGKDKSSKSTTITYKDTLVVGTTADTTRTIDYKSEEGQKLIAGGAVWFVGLKYPIVGGVYFIQEKFQFSKESKVLNSVTTTEGKHFKNNIVFVFLGSEMHFGDGFMFTPEIDLEFVRLNINGLKNKTALQDTVIAPDMYTLRLGIEKEIKNLKFFDCLTPRAGMVYKYAKSKVTIEDAGGNEDITFNYVETNNDKFHQNRGMKVAAGLGITKRRATIDVSADLMTWAGTIITGPKAAMVSLTVDIAQNARYKEDNNEKRVSKPPQSEPFESQAPAPQSEPDLTEPTDDFDADIE